MATDDRFEGVTVATVHPRSSSSADSPEQRELGGPDPWSERWETAAELGLFTGGKLGPCPPDRASLLDLGDPWFDRKGLPTLPRGKVGILAGAGGVGKSTAAVDLAVAVAAAHASEPAHVNPGWLGGALRVRPSGAGRVLLVLGEEDREDVRRRLWHALRSVPQDMQSRALERLEVVAGAGKRWALLDEHTGAPSDVLGALKRRLQAGYHRADDGAWTCKPSDGWALIILDPLSRFGGADTEKDNAAATRFVEALEGLTHAPGNPSVVLLHHESQSGKEGTAHGVSAIRGATGLVDGVRWAARFREVRFGARGKEPGKSYDPRRVRFEVVKANYGPPVGGLDLVQTTEARGRLTVPSKAHREGWARQDGSAEQEGGKADRKGRDPEARL